MIEFACIGKNANQFSLIFPPHSSCQCDWQFLLLFSLRKLQCTHKCYIVMQIHCTRTVCQNRHQRHGKLHATNKRCFGSNQCEYITIFFCSSCCQTEQHLSIEQNVQFHQALYISINATKVRVHSCILNV